VLLLDSGLVFDLSGGFGAGAGCLATPDALSRGLWAFLLPLPLLLGLAKKTAMTAYEIRSRR
jgi:hypothetical protein